MTTKHRAMVLACVATLFACSSGSPGDGSGGSPTVNRDAGSTASSSYFDNNNYDDVLSGGVHLIPVETSAGTFRVWTKRIGNNPRIKVLLLHGGPGMTHEYFEAFDSYFPGAGIQYYYYDQLGSFYSDQPEDDALWTVPRFVDEVEQVRRALGLDSDDFYLYGHSWGGILALEYALRYQQHLKGLIISNMMSSIPAYNDYARKVLMPEMDQTALTQILALEKEGRTDAPRYMELLMPNFYTQHILRMPPGAWPDPVMRAMNHVNEHIYVLMQGPSEMGASGRLAGWDRTGDLPSLSVPTLTIGARYDTMDPDAMSKMANEVQRGRYLFCPDGSHLAMYDDQKTYMNGVIQFIRDVDQGGSNAGGE